MWGTLLTWRLRQSPGAVRSSRVSGPGRDKAKAQSGGAREVAVPRSAGARGRSQAPTLPAGPSSANNPAMARRESSSGVPTPGPAPTQRGGRGRGLELHPPQAPPQPLQVCPQRGAERGMGVALWRSSGFRLHPIAPLSAEAAYPCVGGASGDARSLLFPPLQPHFLD